MSPGLDTPLCLLLLSGKRADPTDFFVQKLPFNFYMKGIFAFQEAAALCLAAACYDPRFICAWCGGWILYHDGFTWRAAGHGIQQNAIRWDSLVCVNRSRNSYVNFVPFQTTLLVLCRAHITTYRTATSTAWTSSNSVLSPQLLLSTRICFHVFLRSTGKFLMPIFKPTAWSAPDVVNCFMSNDVISFFRILISIDLNIFTAIRNLVEPAPSSKKSSIRDKKTL